MSKNNFPKVPGVAVAKKDFDEDQNEELMKSCSVIEVNGRDSLSYSISFN